MAHARRSRLLQGGGAALVLLVVTLSIAAGRPAQDEPPTKREVEKLVEEYVSLKGRTAEGIARQDEILARLELVEPLTERTAKTWRKKIDKLWAKGPKLEKKSGRQFLWEDEKRGLYIVGGETKRPKGLFIGMHGGGAGSGDAGSSHGAYNGIAGGEKWLAIFPEVLEKVNLGWTENGTEEFVLQLVDRACRTWKIDRDRVYLGGHSMGGFGTWTLGGHHADRVAGLIPSAGAPTQYLSGGEVVDIDEGIVPNLRNTAIVIYQSDDDVQVPPGANRMAAKRLREAKERWGGYDFEYWEVPGRGHQPPPGGYAALVEKIRDKVRTPRPDKVVWEQRLSWKRQFYWLWCGTPKSRALVVAELDREANTVSVVNEGGAADLAVLLDGELLDLEREVVVFLNEQEVFRGIPTRSLVALLSTAAHGDAVLTFDVRIPLTR